MQILNQTNFEAEVLKAQGLVLVDFFADWCGPCQLAGPILEKLSKEYEGKVKMVKVNVDESQELAAKYEVMSIPTLFFFKNGQETKRQAGFSGEADLKSLIEEQLR